MKTNYSDPSYFKQFSSCQEFIIDYAKKHYDNRTQKHSAFSRKKLFEDTKAAPWKQLTIKRSLLFVEERGLIYRTYAAGANANEYNYMYNNRISEEESYYGHSASTKTETPKKEAPKPTSKKTCKNDELPEDDTELMLSMLGSLLKDLVADGENTEELEDDTDELLQDTSDSYAAFKKVEDEAAKQNCNVHQALLDYGDSIKRELAEEYEGQIACISEEYESQIADMAAKDREKEKEMQAQLDAANIRINNLLETLGTTSCRNEQVVKQLDNKVDELESRIYKVKSLVNQL